MRVRGNAFGRWEGYGVREWILSLELFTSRVLVVKNLEEPPNDFYRPKQLFFSIHQFNILHNLPLSTSLPSTCIILHNHAAQELMIKKR